MALSNPISNPAYDPKDEPALKRMHFLNGRWDQLNWYLELSRKDLTLLTEGEWTILQEDVVAIHRTLAHSFIGPPPRRQTLADFQQEVSRHFSHLRDGGEVSIGPLKVTHKILLHRKFSNPARPRLPLKEFFTQSPIEGDADIEYSLNLPNDDWRSWLLDHFARLLGEFGSSIRRCPHCSKMFLQFRKSAIFCGRVCQNRAGAKAARTRNRIKKAKYKHGKSQQKKSSKRK